MKFCHSEEMREGDKKENKRRDESCWGEAPDLSAVVHM